MPVARQLAARRGRGLAGPGRAAGCRAAATRWIVQREVQDVTQYAELWLRDAGDHRGDPAEYPARYDAWLDEFEARKVKAVGFGWITLRRTGAEEPVITVEEWPHAVEQPLGRHVAGALRPAGLPAHARRRGLLAGRFRSAAEVVQEQVGLPGAEDPEHVVLRQHRGMRRATKVDTVGAGFAGVCDGSLSAGRILDAIAQLVGEDPVLLRDRTPAADPPAGGAGVPGTGGVTAEAGGPTAAPARVTAEPASARPPGGRATATARPARRPAPAPAPRAPRVRPRRRAARCGARRGPPGGVRSRGWRTALARAQLRAARQRARRADGAVEPPGRVPRALPGRSGPNPPPDPPWLAVGPRGLRAGRP